MSDPHTTLAAKFAKFAGREVQVESRTFGTGAGPMSKGITITGPAANDPVIAEIKQEAKSMGLHILVGLEGDGGMEGIPYNSKRLNITLGKDKAGTWRVRQNFFIG